MLIISQVALVGLIFNHLILQGALRNNRKAQENNVVQFVSTSFYHTSRKLAVLLLICCISIIVFSTAIMLLSSYELAQNLELDMSSAFGIIYSTPVGDVWMLRIVTSFMVIGIIISYYIKMRRKINKKNGLNQRQDQDSDQIVFSYGKLDRILLISILVLSSFNLYSNSMVSHSNSLDSFSSLAVSVDWIHFMSVSIWIGGLFYLTVLFAKRNFITPNEADIIDKNVEPTFSEKRCFRTNDSRFDVLFFHRRYSYQCNRYNRIVLGFCTLTKFVVVDYFHLRSNTCNKTFIGFSNDIYRSL